MPVFRTVCGCGRHGSQGEHDHAVAAEKVVEEALLRALFPDRALRRRFLAAVGAGTALSALASVFPLGAAKEAFAQGAGKIEKPKLKVGFIPITCATPIIMAHPMGFYAGHGLDVEVVKTAGWAVIRDKTLNKEYDAAHMLADAARDHARSARARFPPCRRRKHQRPGDHARIKHKTA
jgi:nitrate/nitrite transport system substrate-binding protein